MTFTLTAFSAWPVYWALFNERIGINAAFINLFMFCCNL